MFMISKNKRVAIETVKLVLNNLKHRSQNAQVIEFKISDKKEKSVLKSHSKNVLCNNSFHNKKHSVATEFSVGAP